MEMTYRERWELEIAEMRRVLARFAMKEECKWGKPTYTVDGKNVLILQGFKEYFGLGFFQGALRFFGEAFATSSKNQNAGARQKLTHFPVQGFGWLEPEMLLVTLTPIPLGVKFTSPGPSVTSVYDAVTFAGEIPSMITLSRVMPFG